MGPGFFLGFLVFPPFLSSLIFLFPASADADALSLSSSVLLVALRFSCYSLFVFAVLLRVLCLFLWLGCAWGVFLSFHKSSA